MEDLNDKMRERWGDRRKKNSNWPKLIIMVLILVAIFIAMDQLNKASQKSAAAVESINPQAQQDSLAAGQTAPVPDSTGDKAAETQEGKAP